jgi:hypothetical protein
MHGHGYPYLMVSMAVRSVVAKLAKLVKSSR